MSMSYGELNKDQLERGLCWLVRILIEKIVFSKREDAKFALKRLFFCHGVADAYNFFIFRSDAP